MGVGLQVAEAGASCKWVKTWCPHETKHYDNDGHPGKPHPVPEPATLMLLGAGVSAVGAAVLRNRKKK